MKSARPLARDERRNHATSPEAPQMTLDEAKQLLTIPALWVRLDLPGDCRKNPCHSPFYECVSKASFSVFNDRRAFNDLRTGDGGSAVDFLILATGLSRDAACRKFIEMAGGQTCDARPLPQRPAAASQPRQRPTLPTMEDGTDEDLQRLATLRNVSFPACFLARSVKLLTFATLKGQRVWIVTDSEAVNAQARRLDGGTWAHLDGAKAWTLPGCWASWPIGIELLGLEETPPMILLVEGGPDLLAALHFIHATGGACRWLPCAMLGAKQRLHEDALPLFAGKRVRIFPHDDEPGRAGAEGWARQLAAVGADVDCFAFAGLRKADGSPVKDLNDCTSIHADDAAELEGLLP